MKRVFITFLTMLLSALASYSADTSRFANVDMSISIPEFLSIKSVSSPVLIANVRNKNGNLDFPLRSKFRVISNSGEERKLYLKANVTTDSGNESAIFKQSGQVYIAFANCANPPTRQSLINCKNGGLPNESPQVVAYPIIEISGGINKKFEEDNYEITIENGITDIDVMVGTNVLPSSFSSNDKKGYYKTILSLTESNI